MRKKGLDIKKTIKKNIELRHQRLAFIKKRNVNISHTLVENKNVNIVSAVKVKTPIITIVEKTNEKICVFNQFFGLGDILFIEPIMRRYFQNGYKVILPVLNKYLDLQPYFPYIEFVDKELYKINYDEHKIIDDGNKLILPLRWSREFFNSTYKDTMRNKYLMVNMNLDEWKSLIWLRHRHKEEALKKLLNINEGDKYNLINKNFHTFFDGHREIIINNGLKNIEMNFIDGYTLLDWSGIIESATTIHTVDTSIMFLLETLKLSTDDIQIYNRYSNRNDFYKTNYLFEKKYIKHN